MNINTRTKGSFPVGCTLPRVPTKVVIFNVSDLDADMMGGSIIEGAKLAYPHLLEVHRFNSSTLNPEHVLSLLDSDVRNFKVICCGPVGMNSRVVDMLTEFGGHWTKNMKILTSDRCN